MISLYGKLKTLKQTAEILLTAVAIFALAATSASAFYIRAQGSGEDNNAYGTIMRYTNEQDRDDIHLTEEQMLNPYEVIAIYDGEYNTSDPSDHDAAALGADGNLLISQVDTSLTTEEINFAAFVFEGMGDNNPDPPTTPFTVKFFGARGYNEELVGKTFYVYIDNVISGSFVWSNDYLSAANPAFEYTFTNLSNMIGLENAVIITLSTATPHYPDGTEIPEPASIAYAIMGIATVAGMKRRTIKK